jgi:hypothetical protein
MLPRPIIPIIFGLHDHYDKIAPPHSYINAAKFENMKKLADYLILLDKMTRYTTNISGGNLILNRVTNRKMLTLACVIFVPLCTTRQCHRKFILT